MSKYRCYIETVLSPVFVEEGLKELHKQVIAIDDNPDFPATSGPQAFMNGFWCTRDYKLSIIIDDLVYWIPSSSIIHIEKL